ncbi:MAG: hypothetical protein ACI4NM_11550 [Bullifex sp.]
MADRIESIIRANTRKEVEFKYHQKELFFREATDRKIKAARRFEPILREKLGDKYPDMDWEKMAADFASMSGDSPDSINEESGFLLAVSIFILDAITPYSTGRPVNLILDDMLPPDSVYENIDEANDYFFYDVFEEKGTHPYYSNDLLMLVTRILSHRNSDFVTYGNRKNCLYLLDKATVLPQRPQVIEGNPKTRAIYEKLVAMVPASLIEEAREEYIKLFWTVADKYIESWLKLQKRKKKLENIVEYEDLQIKEKMLSHIRAGEFSFLEGGQHVSIDNRKELDKLDFIELNFNDNYCYGISAYPNLVNRYTRNFEDLNIIDPYKIIAGFFFLLEEKSDYVWFTGPAMSALCNAVNLLPWNWDSDFESEDWKKIDQERKNCTPHSSSFYRISLDKDKIGIPDYEYHLSPAQLIHAYTDAIAPRTMPDFPFSNVFINNAESMDLVKETIETYLVAHAVSNHKHSTVNDFDDIDSDLMTITEQKSEIENLKAMLAEKDNTDNLQRPQKPADDYKARISELETEISTLRNALEREKRIQNRIRSEKTDLEMAVRSEREELYSLRELVFSDENEPASDDKAEEVSFPLSTRLRHVVIGGHEAWLRKIRDMVPDVKFLGDRVPPKEMLKHTDVLWFQTHAGLSHSLFYKVMEDVRNLKVPVLYLTSSGSKSNAIQIYEYDSLHR